MSTATRAELQTSLARCASRCVCACVCARCLIARHTRGRSTSDWFWCAPLSSRAWTQVRCGLVFRLHSAVGGPYITAREAALGARARAAWASRPHVILAGGAGMLQRADATARLPIVSFNIVRRARLLHWCASCSAAGPGARAHCGNVGPQGFRRGCVERRLRRAVPRRVHVRGAVCAAAARDI